MLNDKFLAPSSNLLSFSNIFDKVKFQKPLKKAKENAPKTEASPKDNIIEFSAKGKASASMEASGVFFPHGLFSGTSNSSTTVKPENTIMISDYKIDDQGNTNACGTTSLTSVLKHYGSDLKDHWQIDKDVRSTRFDMFTAPDSVIDYAHAKGFNAGMKNNADISELVKYVNKGVPAMVLIDTTPDDVNDTALHWEVVTGYQKDKSGKVSHLMIANPGSGSVETQDVESFKKEWGSVKLGSKLPVVGNQSINTGYNNMMVVITPKNKHITAPNGTKTNSNNITVPHDSNPLPGKAAGLLGKGARVLDDAINLEHKVEKKINQGTTYIAKKFDQAEKAVSEKLSEGYHFVAKKADIVEKEVVDAVHTVEHKVTKAANFVEEKLSDSAHYVEHKVSDAGSYAYDKVASGISLVSGLFD